MSNEKKDLIELSEELWDKYSEHIDDNIYSLEQVAGSVIMKRHEFDKLFAELKDLQNAAPAIEGADKSQMERLIDLTHAQGIEIMELKMSLAASAVPKAETREVYSNGPISATTMFKLYLNSIIEKVPDDVHNELWNKLLDCIREAPVPREGMRPVVKWFAEMMEAKLRKNDHKGGWLNDSSTSLFTRLQEESWELKQVLAKGVTAASSEKLINEAADVANFAMMIADICGKKIGSTKSESSTPIELGASEDELLTKFMIFLENYRHSPESAHWFDGDNRAYTISELIAHYQNPHSIINK